MRSVLEGWVIWTVRDEVHLMARDTSRKCLLAHNEFAHNSEFPPACRLVIHDRNGAVVYSYDGTNVSTR